LESKVREGNSGRLQYKCTLFFEIKKLIFLFGGVEDLGGETLFIINLFVFRYKDKKKNNPPNPVSWNTKFMKNPEVGCGTNVRFSLE
jgi:hypothetical protein